MTQATRDKAFRKAQAARGLVKVTVWVPADQRAAFRALAGKARASAAWRKDALERGAAASGMQGLPPSGAWRE